MPVIWLTTKYLSSSSWYKFNVLIRINIRLCTGIDYSSEFAILLTTTFYLPEYIVEVPRHTFLLPVTNEEMTIQSLRRWYFSHRQGHCSTKKREAGKCSASGKSVQELMNRCFFFLICRLRAFFITDNTGKTTIFSFIARTIEVWLLFFLDVFYLRRVQRKELLSCRPLDVVSHYLTAMRS